MTITARFAGAALLLGAMSSLAAAQDKSQLDRGREVYQK